MNGLAHQRGMGYWGYMLVIICVVVFGKLGMVTIPPYIEDRALDKLITDKLATAGNKSSDKVLQEMQNQMRMDFSEVQVEDIVEVVNSAPGSLVFKTNYDVRKKLFGHIDIVNHFEKEYRQ